MLRRLAQCVRQYKWAAMLSPLCMIGEVAMEVTIPLIIAGLYDNGVMKSDMDVIIRDSVILVLCAVASLAFGVLSAIFASKAGTGFGKNLRQKSVSVSRFFSRSKASISEPLLLTIKSRRQ